MTIMRDRNHSHHKDNDLDTEVNNHSRRGFISMAAASLLALSLPAQRTNPNLYFVCSPLNDLFKVAGMPGHVFETTQRAIDAANSGAGILILAERYPASPTPFDQEMINMAAKKHLRLYVEYPAWLPEMDVGFEKAGAWDRAVITTSRFGARLKPSRIVSVNDCHYVSVAAPAPDIVLGRIAGFDTAVYGLKNTETHPILFENSDHSLLVATTKLSQFRTARYGPSSAWVPIWGEILEWLSRGKVVDPLRWKPVVRPSYGKIQAFPDSAEGESFRRGVKWFFNSRILIDESWQHQVDTARLQPDSIAPAPAHDWPIGDGSCGMLEGYSSRIDLHGSQPVRWALRADCMGETSLALALSYAINGQKRCNDIANNLIKFIYGSSTLAGGPRAQQASPSFGLLNWDVDSKGLYYGDDNARCILGIIGAVGLSGTSEWDKNILRTILANFRTTGVYGFRGDKIKEADLQNSGVRYYQRLERKHFDPHYEAYPWALYLWAYAKTGYQPLLDRTIVGIRAMMGAYPDTWQWSYGTQPERARMLLPLAWLVRVQDNSEHRGWLRRMTEDLLKHQDPTGAILEEIGQQSKGGCGPPASNADYGTAEASLIQVNGDSVCDLLYTMNFAFLGLHEAAAATGDRYYEANEDRLAQLLCRIQIRSEEHPELDGGWFRAFSPAMWDYWASNSDSTWGAWTIESGWTQAWITSVLGMRSKAVSLWTLTEKSKISVQMDSVLHEFASSGGI
jgi:hypothetical protein